VQCTQIKLDLAAAGGGGRIHGHLFCFCNGSDTSAPGQWLLWLFEQKESQCVNIPNGILAGRLAHPLRHAVDHNFITRRRRVPVVPIVATCGKLVWWRRIVRCCNDLSLLFISKGKNNQYLPTRNHTKACNVPIRLVGRFGLATSDEGSACAGTCCASHWRGCSSIFCWF